jgi:hypothetical protein
VERTKYIVLYRSCHRTSAAASIRKQVMDLDFMQLQNNAVGEFNFKLNKSDIKCNLKSKTFDFYPIAEIKTVGNVNCSESISILLRSNERIPSDNFGILFRNYFDWHMWQISNNWHINNLICIRWLGCSEVNIKWCRMNTRLKVCANVWHVSNVDLWH